MATATVHAANVHFSADRHIARWRPLLQWRLAVPHLVVVNTLSTPPAPTPAWAKTNGGRAAPLHRPQTELRRLVRCQWPGPDPPVRVRRRPFPGDARGVPARRAGCAPRSASVMLTTMSTSGCAPKCADAANRPATRSSPPRWHRRRHDQDRQGHLAAGVGEALRPGSPRPGSDQGPLRARRADDMSRLSTSRLSKEILTGGNP